VNEKDEKCVLICINNRNEKNSEKKISWYRKILTLKAKILKKALGHAIKKKIVQKFMENRHPYFSKKSLIKSKMTRKKIFKCGLSVKYCADGKNTCFFQNFQLQKTNF